MDTHSLMQYRRIFWWSQPLIWISYYIYALTGLFWFRLSRNLEAQVETSNWFVNNNSKRSPTLLDLPQLPIITHERERTQYRKIVTKSKSKYKIHAYAYTSMKSTGHHKSLYLQNFIKIWNKILWRTSRIGWF